MDSLPVKSGKRPAISPQWARWVSVLEEWKASGLSPADFCARRSIVFSKFRWWRGHISKRGTLVSQGKGAGAKPAFVPLVVRAASANAEAAILEVPPLELVLRGGCVVRVPAGFDEVCLVRLVAALESSRCG